MILRPYQRTIIENVRSAYAEGHAGVILQLMTGAGKTFTALQMTTSVPQGQGQILIIVHRHELVSQWRQEAKKLGIQAGVVNAQGERFNPAPWAQIQICMVQTLARRIKNGKDPFRHTTVSWIIVDECHLATSNSYLRIYEQYPLAKRMGLTATPDRLDGRGFPWASSMKLGPKYHDLQKQGALVPFTTYTIDKLNYSGLRKTFGDYTAASQAQQFETQPLVGNVVETYLKHAKGRTGITFATTRSHAKKLHKEFLKNGINSEYLDGATPGPLREHIIRSLSEGKLQQLINVDVCIEGLNIPRVSVVSIARATCSITRWRQMAGRALRPAPNKTDAIILDHGGNALRHGNLDYDHAWSLKPTKAASKNKEQIARAKNCPDCAGVMPIGTPTCSICGCDLSPKERQPKARAGELKQLKSSSAPVKQKRKSSKDKEKEMAQWLTYL